MVGASGYAGIELLRLCAAHPDLDVVVATANEHAGEAVSRHTPSLAAAYPSLTYSSTSASALDGLDAVFLALPHGQSQQLVPELLTRVGVIVDLAADFRLQAPEEYKTWYGEDHSAPELMGRFVYGLPELHRQQLEGASLIAAPGCYPTAAILALAPLMGAHILLTPGLDEPAADPVAGPALLVDAASGVSGAGRAPRPNLHFGAVDEDFVAYGLLDHRHTAEMEQGLGASVLFTPHLAPMVRGILATCYGRVDGTSGLVTTDDVMEILHAAYDHERFVVVTDDPPSTKATTGSNCAHVTARVDSRTGWVVVMAAIDNLIKGASGQAIQCVNLALGLPEDTGLPLTGTYP